MRRKLMAACLVLLLPPALSAQTVRGVVVDQLERPLAGVVVQLTDSTARTVARALTDERGAFRLGTAAPGRYRLRSTRIGHRPADTEWFRLGDGDELTRRLVLASIPVVLDAMRATARSECTAHDADSTTAAFAAWEQVRAALTAADLSERAELAASMLTYERQLDLDGRVVRQSGTVDLVRDIAANIWHSPPADSLRKVGYVVTTPDGKARVFQGPDARVLSSDEFQEDHCFTMTAGDESRVGVSFEPTPARRGMPEIVGTMWLDRRTAELQAMEWRYVNVARNVDPTVTGGSARFTRLANGAWVLSRWDIRMPYVVMSEGDGAVSRVAFRGTKVVGATLLSVSSAAGADTLWTEQAMTLNGFAFDSVGRRAMTSALIGIAGTNRTTISDSAGYFSFPGLPPGAYRLITQHDALEAMGIPYQVTPAVLASDGDSVVVAMPSFETIWRIACESVPPGKDTALVYGTIRDASRATPVRGASVMATWLDIDVGRDRKIVSKRWRLDARADSAGAYVLCGVPSQTGLRLRAASDSADGALIDMLPLGERLIERRDIAISFDPAARGAVTGTVRGRNGVAIGGARVAIASGPEVRTDNAGRFALRDVGLGTQQLEVTAVGLEPATRIVDVTGANTEPLEIYVTRPVVLNPVNVVASSVRQQFIADYATRRTKGLGTFRDSTAIGEHGTLHSALAQIPGVQVSRGKVFFTRSSRSCEPLLWLDGVHMQSIDDLMALRPNELAALEVYQSEASVPPQFIVRKQFYPPCGVIVAWTKWYWEGNRPQSRPPR